MVSKKTQRYHKALLTKYGFYITHKEKALNPKDVTIIFYDEKSENNEIQKSCIEIIDKAKKYLNRKSIIEKMLKL